MKIIVIACDRVTTDVPAYRRLVRDHPARDWPATTRGVAATAAIPVCSCGAENLLCLLEDRYWGESILVHELAHTVLDLAAAAADATLRSRIADAYARAMRHGLWMATYAATNPDEYWAEGVQSWFDANHAAPTWSHNGVGTRAALAAYDPALARLIAEVFGPTPWRFRLRSGSWDALTAHRDRPRRDLRCVRAPPLRVTPDPP